MIPCFQEIEARWSDASDTQVHPRSILIAALAAIVVTGVAAATTAGAAAPEPPPINDNYLTSLNLNNPHTKLNREDTLTDVRNTSAATVQSDILSPQPGPAELTGCEGVSEGKTMWYDFFPDANGFMRVRTSATFGTVMAVMPYNPTTLLPENNERVCAVNEPTKAGELFASVQAGKSYTVQIGGVDEAGAANSRSCSTTSCSSSTSRPKPR